jgi:murein DD-endopeptidase MepM/ murein hydrolase activator NlpD
VSRKALVLLVVSILSAPEAVVAAGARERWRRPLPGGAVAGSFTFERAIPYVRGRRRGIDFRGREGARVVAPCAGIVTYSGRVPGPWGRGVTLRCAGGLVATELGLASVAVTRGALVVTGEVVGTLGDRGLLRLGAREAADRQGYLDPAALLGGEDGPSVPVLAPPSSQPPREARRLPLAPRAVAPPPAAARPRAAARPHAVAPPPAAARPRAAARPHAVASPRAVAPPHAAPLPPAPVLAGLALLAVAATGGRGARRRRRGRVQAGMAVPQR